MLKFCETKGCGRSMESFARDAKRGVYSACVAGLCLQGAWKLKFDFG